MVLKITVKTLDSQNYQFEAQQDWTITQFKEHIQEMVNVPATEQRLIFCGRVLQNDKKLTEYDCNDKVIHLVRRPPPSPGDESPNRRMATEMQDNFGFHPSVSPRDSMHLEGSFIITATTVETTTSATRPQATATVFVTSDSGPPGANIPFTIPLSINTQTGIPILPASFPIPNFFNQGVGQVPNQQPSQPTQQQDQQPINTQNHQSQAPQPDQQNPEQRSSTGESINSNSSVTQPQYAMISGLVPVQFEYLLTYLPTSSDPTGGTNPRIQFRPSRRSGFIQNPLNPNQNQTSSQADGQQQAQAGTNNATSMDPNSMEIISTILNSIFRQPNQPSHLPQQPQPTTQPPTGVRVVFPTSAPNPNATPPTRGTQSLPPFGQDPFMNMIPELAINAASQILGGLFGGPQGQAPAAPAAAAPRPPIPPPQQPRLSSSGSSQYMDVEIDDGSSQSGSRYHDASQDEPVRSTAHSSLNNPSISQSRLRDIFRDRPTWIQTIEADLAAGLREMPYSDRTYFSDGYLSSIPKKRRQMLAATPDRVPILSPSPREAISNILRRSSVLRDAWGNMDQMIESLANDKDVQEAFEEFIKSAVQSRLRSDEDFKPERYHCIDKYFK